MLKTYEAIYSHGQLRWLNQAPPEENVERHVLVVLETAKSNPTTQTKNVRAVLQRTRGILGKKSIPEIDAEINKLRCEWDRE